MVGSGSWRAGVTEALDPEPDADPSGPATADFVGTSFFLDDDDDGEPPLLRRRERAATDTDFVLCILENSSMGSRATPAFIESLTNYVCGCGRTRTRPAYLFLLLSCRLP